MKNLLLAALSGLLAALALPSPGLWPLAFVAWVPLLVALDERRDGARLGLCAGVVFFGVSLRWVALLSVPGFIALVVYLSFWIAAFGALAKHVPRLALPFAWVALEWTRGWAFSGFGWASLGYALPPSLAGLAAIGGLALLSLAIVATNVAIASRSFVALIFPALLLLGPRVTTEGTLRVAAINAGVGPHEKWNNIHGAMTAHAALTDRIAPSKPALYVWPETAIPAALDVPGATPIRSMALTRRVREVWGAPLLLGIPEPAGASFYNAAALVDGERVSVVYRKRRLVPFGERAALGFAPVLPGPKFVPGEGPRAPLVIDGARLSILICFEDLFADDALARARDSDVLVVLTNDAWLGSAGAAQHLAITRLRAIEVGRSIVRAANRGATTAIDPSGRSLAPEGEAVVTDVPRSRARTLYSRAPDLLPLTCVAVALGALAWTTSRRRREVA